MKFLSSNSWARAGKSWARARIPNVRRASQERAPETTIYLDDFVDVQSGGSHEHSGHGELEHGELGYGELGYGEVAGGSDRARRLGGC